MITRSKNVTKGLKSVKMVSVVVLGKYEKRKRVRAKEKHRTWLIETEKEGDRNREVEKKTDPREIKQRNREIKRRKVIICKSVTKGLKSVKMVSVRVLGKWR